MPSVLPPIIGICVCYTHRQIRLGRRRSAMHTSGDNYPPCPAMFPSERNAQSAQTFLQYAPHALQLEGVAMGGQGQADRGQARGAPYYETKPSKHAHTCSRMAVRTAA